MTILDLIKRTAVIFDIDDILKDSNLENFTESAQNTILGANDQLNRMFELVKLVLGEVYSYISKEVEIVVNSIDGCIDKSVLGSVGRIVSVKDQYGSVNYTFKDNGIIVGQAGEYVVKCVIAPNTKYLSDKIDMFNMGISEDLLVNGLNSYYCLTAGLFEEYNVYNARYIDALTRLKNPKLFAMPCRSWHE